MATEPIPLVDEQESFFAPSFEIKVDRGPLPRATVRDVMEVTYEDSIDKVDSFTLVVNNWDTERKRAKYLYAERSVFDPGRQLEFYLGYQGHPERNFRLMMTGIITTLEASFPESGPPTLTVRGLNIMNRFRRKQYTWAWFDKKDSEIAKELSREPDQPAGRPGLGIEVRTGEEALEHEPRETYVFMNNQYPIVFLMERARRRGYSLFIGEERNNGNIVRFLNFGPSEHLRDITYELEWGKSLLNVTPTLTTTNQVSKVTVLGWNRSDNSRIEGVAELSNPRCARMNPDLHGIAREAAREEVITDRPVRSKEEAEALATDILLHQLRQMVQVDGETVGLPDLRAGRALVLKKLGLRIDGRYFVTQTRHVLNDQGYRTTFSARREEPSGGGQ